MEQQSEKLDKGAIPGIAIDGVRIRNVREAKKLTQLYVANVVGVTTDTISRWENNRYPSIKRDNAEKLARALEVDLREILRQDEPSEAVEPRGIERSRRGTGFWTAIALGVIAAVVAIWYILSGQFGATPVATRWLPRFAAPGEIVPVQIKVTRRPGEEMGFILKERLPAGARLVNSLPASSAADSSVSVIKWLIPRGSASVTVSYTVRMPEVGGTHKELKFEGEIVLKSGESTRTEHLGGADTVRVGSYHWADHNGDGRIDDDEIMPAYYVCEEMKGLGLDWNTIEAIWSGKGYRWSPKGGFLVVK